MSFIKILPALTCFALIAYSGSALANSCSKADIDHYLKSGFTHDQVVKLCTDTATTPSVQSSGNLYQSISTPDRSAPVATATPLHNNPSANITPSRVNNDQVYFETVVEGNPVTITADKLSFDRRECAIYGDVDMTGFRDKACVDTRTTINLKGLQILRATKGVFLIKEQELLVKGNITREYLNTSGLNKYKMKAVNQQLPTQPTKLNIPIKKGIDPRVVAGKLKKYQ